MREYTHYGKVVVKQVINKDFRSELKSNGVSFTDLPIINNDFDVIKYTSGTTKYAVIQDKHIPEEFWQAVYITEQIPDDCDWSTLIADVDAQEDGAEQMLMASKLKTIIDAAESLVMENKHDIESILEGVSIEDIGWSLISMGYNKSKISGMDTHDVDGKFLNDLMEWMA